MPLFAPKARVKATTSTSSGGKQSARKSKASQSAKTTTEGSTSEKVAAAAAPAPGRASKKRVTAADLAAKQREISVSEFFAKNRHLLGFDNPRRALLTSVKEAVDNALDACEEADVLPEVTVRIRDAGNGNNGNGDDRYTISIQDNGPGIVAAQIPNIFGKLLYGSKFHRLKQSRGQQGIGISAAGMYGLMTTGRSVRITSRTGPRAQAHYYEIQIDTRKNRPEIIKDENVEWDCPHGTRVDITLAAKYQKGRQSVDRYLEQTAIANPHATIVYDPPVGSVVEYPRAVEELPPAPKEIRPHPYGVELGVLIRMLKDTDRKTLHAFLSRDFSRVSDRVAGEIIERAGLTARSRPTRIGRHEAETLFDAVQQTKIMAPPTNCVVPIGEEELIKGLKKTVEADFYTATTRRPAVYRGNPFLVETALAYGGECGNEETLMSVMRLANRVPLLYQQGACVMYNTMLETNWRAYALSQSRGALPTGPILAVVHIASAWVPFTSESKEAVASYPEIEKEIRLAIQDCGRRLKIFINRRRRVVDEQKKRSYIEKYLPHVAEALRDILALSERQTNQVVADLTDVLERTRKM